MVRRRLSVCTLAALLMLTAFGGPVRAQTSFKCDPVDPVADAGWSVVPSLETVGEADSAPYQAGAAGDWFVDHTTTRLPFCNYYNDLGIYSLRSYTLSPQVSTQRVAICKTAPAGGTVAVAPYAGPCPPR
jgi:hypothetical protein